MSPPEQPRGHGVTQITIGRFHHFHLARELERRNLLERIWSGYPRRKLADEVGVPTNKISTYPWIQVPYLAAGRLPSVPGIGAARRELAWWAHESLDRRVARSLAGPTDLVALSGSGLAAGLRAKTLGGRYFCDRGSTHIVHQDSILREEHARWGVAYPGVDHRVIAKEQAEYEVADAITVPSSFVRETFLARGVPAAKMRLIPYGGRLDRFAPCGTPPPDALTFVFVGAASVRKGIGYLLQAFAALDVSSKRLRVIGHVGEDARALLATLPTHGVEFVGPLPNSALAAAYSSADALILPSVEEGLAMVMAEALACGCPVIATPNTGAADLFDDGVHGLMVAAGSAAALREAMQDVADGRLRSPEVRAAARARIAGIGGWQDYGDRWEALLNA